MTIQVTHELCCEPQSRQAGATSNFLRWPAKMLSGLHLRKKKCAELPIHDARAMADIGLGINGRDGSLTRIAKEIQRQEMIAVSLMGR
uniref:hypothetical protein n=1 Tax=Pararhizobium sp. IMCC3301 TaxID=3067904 RepID=UPI002741FBF7|nr:hypothetical protein [Pararhizobium sp. IMCC3301]